MAPYILRRLGQAALTILGVMVITFLLFRVIAGDIAAAQLGEKSTAQQRATWRHRHGYDQPLMVNFFDRRLMLEDRTSGKQPFVAKDLPGSNVANALSLILASRDDYQAMGLPSDQPPTLIGRYVTRLSPDTPIERLTDKLSLVGHAVAAPAEEEPPKETAPRTVASSEPATESQPATSPSAASQNVEPDTAPSKAAPLAPHSIATPAAILALQLSDGTKFQADLTGVKTAGELMDRINRDPANGGRVIARASIWSPRQLFQSQFFHHLYVSATFQTQSLKDDQPLTTIIAKRAPASLALQIPSLAIEWVIGMVIACFVAYYRGSWLDRLGVFIAVIGMCIPFLAFMIYGQWFMFLVSPAHMYGIENPWNIYVPVAIMVLAGVGSQVRFYRTIILDETNRDYVRTAKAKGVPLPGILFRHVLRNCMLPILTSLMVSIPFLFLGSLLVESYFGIPGLGDLMLTSISDRNEPVINGLVFLTSLIYTLALLLTDISYAIFDPRIRLR